MKKRFILFALCLLSMSFTEAQAQSPDPSNPEVSITQKEQQEVKAAMQQARITDLEIQVRELQAKVAGYEKDQLTERRSAWITAFRGKIDSIRKAHNYGHDVYFDPDTQTFRKMSTVNIPVEKPEPKVDRKKIKMPTKNPEPSMSFTGVAPVPASSKK